MKTINLLSYVHCPCVLAIPLAGSETGECRGVIWLPAKRIVENSTTHIVLHPDFVNYDLTLLGCPLTKQWGGTTSEGNYKFMIEATEYGSAKLAKDAMEKILRSTGYTGPIKRVK